jgi:hypothetical protein
VDDDQVGYHRDEWPADANMIHGPQGGIGVERLHVDDGIARFAHHFDGGVAHVGPPAAHKAPRDVGVVESCPTFTPGLGHARHPRVHVVEMADRPRGIRAQTVKEHRLYAVAIARFQAVDHGLRGGAMTAAGFGVQDVEAEWFGHG